MIVRIELYFKTDTSDDQPEARSHSIIIVKLAGGPNVPFEAPEWFYFSLNGSPKQIPYETIQPIFTL
jgi:hypothetical protein